MGGGDRRSWYECSERSRGVVDEFLDHCPGIEASGWCWDGPLMLLLLTRRVASDVCMPSTPDATAKGQEMQREDDDGLVGECVTVRVRLRVGARVAAETDGLRRAFEGERSDSLTW